MSGALAAGALMKLAGGAGGAGGGTGMFNGFLHMLHGAGGSGGSGGGQNFDKPAVQMQMMPGALSPYGPGGPAGAVAPGAAGAGGPSDAMRLGPTLLDQTAHQLWTGQGNTMLGNYLSNRLGGTTIGNMLGMFNPNGADSSSSVGTPLFTGGGPNGH